MYHYCHMTKLLQCRALPHNLLQYQGLFCRSLQSFNLRLVLLSPSLSRLFDISSQNDNSPMGLCTSNELNSLEYQIFFDKYVTRQLCIEFGLSLSKSPTQYAWVLLNFLVDTLFMFPSPTYAMIFHGQPSIAHSIFK